MRKTLLLLTAVVPLGLAVTSPPAPAATAGAEPTPTFRPRVSDVATAAEAGVAAASAIATAGSPPPAAARFPADLRTIGGTGNNPAHPGWGAAGSQLLRRFAAAYEDGTSTPAGADRPSARLISNEVHAEPTSGGRVGAITDLFVEWGQFLDHDLDLTLIADPAEPFPIDVPTGDPWFDPTATGTATIPLSRSAGIEVGGVRQQINGVTAWIDGSQVYGSDDARALALRALDGSGRLKTSAGDLLPYNTDGVFNLPTSSPAFFLAGDVRANEQAGLTSLHTVFVREHNRWADRIRDREPQLDDDAVYERARALVIAELEAITYREFLPQLLGRNALPAYRGYRPQVEPTIGNEFATAAYRFAHSMLSNELVRLDAQRRPIAAGPLALGDSFFNPSVIAGHGLEPLLRGAAVQRAQQLDLVLVDAIRNFLFGPPGSGGLDLAALDIQRGRDHGLPSYVEVRRALRLPPVRRFEDINRDPAVVARLAAAYDAVEDVDLFVGGLAEPPVRGAAVGPTFHAVLVDQFTRLRDGDRFWYQGYLPSDLVREVERRTLREILLTTTTVGGRIPTNLWRAGGGGGG